MSVNKINWSSFKRLTEQQIEEKAREILSRMTLKEKLKQMSGDGTLLRNGLSMAIRYNKKPIPAGVNKRLGIPGIKFTDGPRGVVMGNATCFPVSMARGASWDINLEERIGKAIGMEARAMGANFFGGVCINLLRHPAWGRAQETYGEDPYHLGEMGAALVRGVQKHVMACAKHYACNSMENARFKVNVKINERTLREIYLPHFKKCVDAGVTSIMSAYNKVNGHYCGHNRHLLTEILKQDWGFRGFVITDFLFGIRDGKQAVNAGVDIEMPFQWKMKPKKLMQYLKNGDITEEQINDSVLRILRMLIQFESSIDPTIYTTDRISCKEHIQLALEAARKSIVLLKNQNNLLPLDRHSIKKIVVLGKLASMENTGDHGSSRVYPPYVVTPLEGIKRSASKNIQVIYNEGKNIQENVEDIRTADAIIIVVGYTHRDEGEYIRTVGGDRVSLTLRPVDEELILKVSEINPNCIVVMKGGSAIIMESWKESCKAILMAWYAGMEEGTAIGEIIFGDVNPSAKLPVTFPKSQDQLPYFDREAEEIEYGYYHGYRLMDKQKFEPAFYFGHGLSYTYFTYYNLRLDSSNVTKGDSITIKFDITNQGKMFGEEIAQLYVGYKNPSIERAVKELKGFKKIALQPGETKTCTLTLNTDNLAFFDAEKNKWIIEPSEYELLLGSSSKPQDLLKAKFNISN